LRIEVSKRIKRKSLSLREFSQFDIFKEYSEKYKKYLAAKDRSKNLAAGKIELRV
jgi:hypothetical protein